MNPFKNESVVGRRTYPTRGCGVWRFGSIPVVLSVDDKIVWANKMRPDIQPDTWIEFKLLQLLQNDIIHTPTKFRAYLFISVALTDIRLDIRPDN